MTAKALALALVLLAAPLVVTGAAEAATYPDVRVEPCPYPTYGWVVYVNGNPVTNCFHEQLA